MIKWVESHKASHCAPHIMINKILYYVTNTGKHLIQIPDSLIYSVIDTSHSTLGAGHPGPERTEQRIKEIYTFPKMSQLIHKYCKTCKSCLSVKGAPPKSAPIANYPLPFKPFSRVHMDILGVLPTCTSTKNKYILVFKDYLTRYVEITPLQNRETKTIANALLQCIIKPHSTPDVLISDNAAEFTSSLLKELCEMWNIKKAEIVARHPSSNSICERENAKIENYLRHFVSSNQHDWDQYLPFAQIALNTTYNTSIGTDPHFLLHSYHKRLPYHPHDYVSPFLHNKQENRKDFVHDYVGEMYTRSMAIRDQARQRLQYNTNKFTEYQHQNVLERKIEIGDSVYILDIKRPFQSPKLAKRWIGPYTVANIINERKYLLLCKVTGKTFVCHKDNFKLALCEVTSTQKLQDYPVLEGQTSEMKRQQAVIPRSNDSAYYMPLSAQHDRQRNKTEHQQRISPSGRFYCSNFSNSSLPPKRSNSEINIYKQKQTELRQTRSLTDINKTHSSLPHRVSIPSPHPIAIPRPSSLHGSTPDFSPPSSPLDSRKADPSFKPYASMANTVPISDRRLRSAINPSNTLPFPPPEKYRPPPLPTKTRDIPPPLPRKLRPIPPQLPQRQESLNSPTPSTSYSPPSLPPRALPQIFATPPPHIQRQIYRILHKILLLRKINFLYLKLSHLKEVHIVV